MKSNLMLWDIIMIAFIWIVWKERNDGLFSKNFTSNLCLFNSILFFVDFWPGHLELPRKKKVCALLVLNESKRYKLLVSGERLDLFSSQAVLVDTPRSGSVLPALANVHHTLKTYSRRK